MARVIAVARDGAHRFSKPVTDQVELVEGIGVRGDAHSGPTVQHLSLVRRDPTATNLRQVHLMHRELFDELSHAGYRVGPGQMGENITTEGIDLLGLPQGTRLHLGGSAVVRVTGLRSPCAQLNGLAPGLLKQLVFVGADGRVVRKTGVMGVVEAGGVVRAGDQIVVELADGERQPLAPV